MYDPPAYLWALIIAGTSAIAVATCVALYGGVMRAGLGRRRAALLAGATAVLLGGWLAASATIAGRGWYDTRLSQMPWMPIAAGDSWPCCWRSAGSRWRRAPWRHRACPAAC